MVTTRTYDAKDNLKSEIDPNGNITSYEYGNFNQVTKVTDSLNHETINVYDDYGNLTRMIRRDADGGPDRITRYSYDTQGNLKSTTDPSDRVTQFFYNGSGNLTRQRLP